ncbi:MAG: TonB-dependent receptor [Chitinophagaceae bacterium]
MRTLCQYSLKGLLILLIFYAQHAFAQNQPSKQITGTVKDINGEAMPGVSIKVKGVAGGGASTSADGKYKIAVAGNNGVLVFTYVGYQTKEQVVGANNVVNITLSDQTSNLDDVVVVGYGAVARKDLTGSVSKVSMADVSKAPVKSFDDALAGRIAGVQVVSPDGQPGASPNIIIRGGNSVTQDNAPLYVIDGFPMTNFDNNSLNPADIESIDVLKDASATAIYGAMGANGVIIVTTKKGKIGRPQINYSTYYGVQSLTNKVEVLGAYEYVKYVLELDSVNNRITTPNFYTYYDIYSPKFNPAGTGATDKYLTQEGVDWQKQVLRDATMQNHDISIRGGNKDTKYAISGSYISQEGLLIASDFKRYQGRMVLDQNINDKLKVGINTNYSFNVTRGLQIGGATTSTLDPYLIGLWRYRPAVRPNETIEDLEENTQDELASGSSNYQWNPKLALTEQRNDRYNTLLNVNAYVEYKVLPELKLRITGGINSNSLRQERFNTSLSRSGSGVLGPNGSRARVELTSLLNENTLTYNKIFAKKHSLNAVVGLSIAQNKRFADRFGATLLPNDILSTDGLLQGTPAQNVTERSSNKAASFLGRVNYGFKGKYLATASFRYDGSSKFLGDKIWASFPSGSVAWRFSEEGFLKKNKILTDGKLRVSYGITGNNRIGDKDVYLALVQGLNNYTPGGVYIPGAYSRSTLANSGLKWESTAEANIGLDLGFLNQRITLTVEAYSKKTTGLLLRTNLAGSTGYANTFQNVGAVQNKGLEFELNTLNIDGKNFKWSSSFNISFNRTKLLALNSGEAYYSPAALAWLPGNLISGVPASRAVIGQPVAMFYGLQADGIYQLSDFNETIPGVYTLKAGVPYIGTAALTKPGSYKFKDLNGDGQINTDDQTVIGNPNPKFIGGFSNNFSYKNLDLNIFFQVSYGNDILNINRLAMESNLNGSNQLADAINRWTPTNPSNTVARAGAYSGPGFYTSRVVEDGSFLRLKTVNLGYHIDPKRLKRLKIASLRFYVSAQNLLTYTKYSGSDPEVNSYPGALTTGADFSSYPRPKVVTFGLNLGF